MVQRPASSFNFQLQFPNDITCYTQVGRYDYIDESTRQVSRNTELNDGDIDIGGNDNVFNSALRQLSDGAASSCSNAVVQSGNPLLSTPSASSAGANRTTPQSDEAMGPGTGVED